MCILFYIQKVRLFLGHTVYAFKHEQNSGINYITVMDSKSVQIVPTAAGGTKIEIPFPKAFYLYNRFMSGVDVHDGHCNKVLPSILSKN